MNSRTFAIVALFLVQLLYGLNYTFAKTVINENFVQPFAFVILRVGGAAILFWLVSFFLPKEKIDKNKIKFFYRRKMNVLNTTNEKFAKINFPNGYKIVNVKCSSLNKVLNKTKYKGRIIDFLNLDVESTEKDVLESLNFSIYKPKLICIEIHFNKLKDLKFNKIYKFLLKKGYILMWRKKYSFIFSIKS